MSEARYTSPRTTTKQSSVSVRCIVGCRSRSSPVGGYFCFTFRFSSRAETGRGSRARRRRCGDRSPRAHHRCAGRPGRTARLGLRAYLEQTDARRSRTERAPAAVKEPCAASFGPKSPRRAATKPSRKVTTIGRSAPKMDSSMTAVLCVQKSAANLLASSRASAMLSSLFSFSGHVVPSTTSVWTSLTPINFSQKSMYPF